MKVLVTGGAGFIGSHIVDALIQEGHQVVVVDNLSTGRQSNLNPRARFYQLDIRAPAFLDGMRAEKPDVVNHHAAQARIQVSTADLWQDAEVNILGTINVLTASVRAGTGKVIFASSGGTVYGTSEQLPISEEQPFNPQSPYGITKVAGEYYLRYFAANYNLKYTALRYANIYGPRDHVSSEHVITVFAEQLLRGERPTIHWDGEQAKDYLYVSDAVRANLLVLERGHNQAYNIGTGIPISVNRIYRALTAMIGTDLKPAYGPKLAGDVRRFYLDCQKAGRELDWFPLVSFEDGLRQTLAWFRDDL